MAEQVFVGEGLVEDVAEGEEVLVASAVYSEQEPAAGGGTVPKFDHHYRMRRAN